MINWRSIVGLVFLIAGMMKFYSIIAANSAGTLSGSPVYAEIGCVVWMAVGVFLVIKGVRNKDN
jgi:uncharacterized membrane protein